MCTKAHRKPISFSLRFGVKFHFTKFGLSSMETGKFTFNIIQEISLQNAESAVRWMLMEKGFQLIIFRSRDSSVWKSLNVSSSSLSDGSENRRAWWWHMKYFGCDDSSLSYSSVLRFILITHVYISARQWFHNIAKLFCHSMWCLSLLDFSVALARLRMNETAH